MHSGTLAAILPAVFTMLAGCAPSAHRETPPPLPEPCAGDQGVYVLGDTVRGVTPPDALSIAQPDFGTQPGVTEARIVIEVDGRVTVEDVLSAGRHGPRQQSQAREVLERAKFYPAVRGGCAVRFRSSMKWETGVARPLLPN